MSAAVEAGIKGIPAIGFSLCDYSWNANFEKTKPYIQSITKSTLKNGLDQGTVLNVNFPYLTTDYKGVKICRQANAHWEETFDKRTNPLGKDYYWLSGTFENYDTGNDTDEWALANQYVSIVPVQFDMTAHQSINKLKNWKL